MLLFSVASIPTVYNKPHYLPNTEDAGELFGLGLTHRLKKNSAGKFPVGNPRRLFRDIILESGAPEHLCSVLKSHDPEPAGDKCWTGCKRRTTTTTSNG